MRRFAGLPLLLVFATVFTSVSNEQIAVADDSKNDAKDEILTAVYRFHDLPVWTAESKFDPNVMMRLIRATTSPSDWKANGGDSTFVPYAENVAVIISTKRRNHDRIKDLLKTIRSQRE